MNDSVYCNDCKHVRVGVTDLFEYVCAHPDVMEDVESATGMYRRYGMCELENAGNDCEHYEPDFMERMRVSFTNIGSKLRGKEAK